MTKLKESVFSDTEKVAGSIPACHTSVSPNISPVLWGKSERDAYLERYHTTVNIYRYIHGVVGAQTYGKYVIVLQVCGHSALLPTNYSETEIAII